MEVGVTGGWEIGRDNLIPPRDLFCADIGIVGACPPFLREGLYAVYPPIGDEYIPQSLDNAAFFPP